MLLLLLLQLYNRADYLGNTAMLADTATISHGGVHTYCGLSVN